MIGNRQLLPFGIPQVEDFRLSVTFSNIFLDTLGCDHQRDMAEDLKLHFRFLNVPEKFPDLSEG